MKAGLTNMDITFTSCSLSLYHLTTHSNYVADAMMQCPSFQFQVLWLRLTFEPKAPSVMQPKAVLSANNFVSCKFVILQVSVEEQVIV